jgi:hypothetical protein
MSNDDPRRHAGLAFVRCDEVTHRNRLDRGPYDKRRLRSD